MAKPRKPLFGYGATGTLAQTLTFQRYRRLLIARRKPTPTDPQSQAQLSQRSAFAQCNFFWTLLTPAQQDTYRQLRYPPNLTGHHRYVRLCLEGKVPPPPGPFVNLWLPDAPPAIPSPYDDEFPQGPIDPAKWTIWDPGAVLTASIQEYGLDLYRATPPADSWAGIIQPLPPGDFTIYTRLSLLAFLTLNRVAALIIGHDLIANPATSAFITIGLDTSYDTIRLRSSRWHNYNTFADDNYFKDISLNDPSIYLSFRSDPAGLWARYSEDGLAWPEIYRKDWPWAPKEIGLAINSAAEAGDLRAIFSFFRYIPTGQALRPMAGDRLVVGWPS